MQYFFPSYYKDFKCIAGECRHNCCIGWEIDIDLDAMSRYFSVGGKFGARLKANISSGDEPHFILGKGDRCPFLNDKNLCDIIITLGEESLCSICADHPRFRNELPGRIETGLGLCCEAAARLILGKKDKFTLVSTGEWECDDEIISLRDKALELISRRFKPFFERVNDIAFTFGLGDSGVDFLKWTDVFLSLERLDKSWTDILLQLKDNICDFDIGGFDAYMIDRQTEFEQLISYFIYRHLANAFDDESFKKRVAFCILSYEMIRAIGAVKWYLTGSFSFEDLVETARAYSSEIEYSDENIYVLLDEL